MLTGLDERAIAAGILLVAAAGVTAPALISRKRWAWGFIELGLVAGLAVAAALELHAAPARPLWVDAVIHPTGLWLVGLALLGACGERALPRGRLAWVAGGGALLVGAIPAAVLVVPAARDARHGVRLALVAGAAGAVSPLGGPAPLLLGAGDPLYSLWALPAALVALLVAWPRGGGEPASEPLPRWLWAPAAGALLSWVVGPTVGVSVASLGALLLGARPTLAGLRWVQWAVVVHLLVAVGHLSGAAWYLGRGLGYVREVWGGAALAGAGALVGSLGEPHLVAHALARGTELSVGTDGSWALVLGLAMAPGPLVLLAAYRHGWRALPLGAGLGAVQVAVVVGWAALL